MDPDNNYEIVTIVIDLEDPNYDFIMSVIGAMESMMNDGDCSVAMACELERMILKDIYDDRQGEY